MNRLLNLISNEFMNGMKMTVHVKDGADIELVPEFSENDGMCAWHYEGSGVFANVTAEAEDESAVFCCELKADFPLSSRAVSFTVDPFFADNVLDYHMDLLWWSICGLPEKNDDLRDQTYGFLFEKDSSYIGVANLLGDVFLAVTDKDGLHLDTRCDGCTEINGYFMTVSENCEPIDAVKNGFVFARNVGAVNVPLRDERDFPELFEDFGWCSWNAFYQDVTADKLYSKLDEFKEKNVPVKWIIIDDGWSLIREGKLASFDADPVKFPEGLGGCIRKIKEEYGVIGVGVWHTLNGYWQGVDPESEIGIEYKDYLTVAKNGMMIPSVDPDKGFVFWDAFHSHLTECGVDFVKVDNQSSAYDYLEGVVPVAEGMFGIHEGIEQSVAKNFDGRIINCMGMNMPNVLARPFTAVSRNSDDFFPNRENGFAKHLRQNLYSAVWHTNIHYGDYDMWWSDKANPVESGVLRALSGGPVYVSDEVGATNPVNLLPVCGKDGSVCRMEGHAMPTKDCMFANCETIDAPNLKGFNYFGDTFALAVYNICNEADTKTESFKFDVIPGLVAGKDYVAYEYFSKKFSVVDAETAETVIMTKGEVKAYSLYPVAGEGDDAYIMLGDCDRYFGIATPGKEKVYVKDIVK